LAGLEIGFGVVNEKLNGENEAMHFSGIKNGNKRHISNSI
jgi:hypothetical protein